MVFPSEVSIHREFAGTQGLRSCPERRALTNGSLEAVFLPALGSCMAHAEEVIKAEGAFCAFQRVSCRHVWAMCAGMPAPLCAGGAGRAVQGFLRPGGACGQLTQCFLGWAVQNWGRKPFPKGCCGLVPDCQWALCSQIFLFLGLNS